MQQYMLFKIILDNPKLTILVKDNKVKGVLRYQVSKPLKISERLQQYGNDNHGRAERH